MTPPAFFRVACHANSVPAESVLLHFILHVRHKNSFTYISEPTDKSGIAIVTWEQLKASSEQDVRLFMMDYTGIADFNGTVSVMACDRTCLERGVDGYSLYSKYISYRPNYRKDLQTALRAWDDFAPGTLFVDVSHDGQDITILTEEVIIPQRQLL